MCHGMGERIDCTSIQVFAINSSFVSPEVPNNKIVTRAHRRSVYYIPDFLN